MYIDRYVPVKKTEEINVKVININSGQLCAINVLVNLGLVISARPSQIKKAPHLMRLGTYGMTYVNNPLLSQIMTKKASILCKSLKKLKPISCACVDVL